MLKNYLNTAWRNLMRNKTYSFINIMSIAIGLSAFWMISLYVGMSSVMTGISRMQAAFAA